MSKVRGPGIVVLLIGLACCAASVGCTQPSNADKAGSGSQTPQVKAEVALASAMALGDMRLKDIAATFQMMRNHPEVIEGDWSRIKPMLAEAEKSSTPSVMWFAKPSGEYWTTEKDKALADLKDRPYFARLLAGQNVIGDLVVSKSTSRNVAIVAVPVLKDKQVVGALGASVYLEALSETIRRDMDLPPDNIFYAFDARPMLAVVYDRALIFNEPKQLGDEVDKAFKEMLTKERGSIRYSFRGVTRDVVYRKSNVTNWWYAFGAVRDKR